MHIEIICVGTELLAGKLNTNVGYIGERLSAIGLDLSLATAVGDDRREMETVFRQALDRSRIIIVTGGLGPTFDDFTREALSAVLDRPLVLNREALQSIVQFFIKRNFDMPKNNERQAYVIEGARLLPNRMGTAPGQLIEVQRKEGKAAIFLLPGPPHEMQVLFDEAVFPYAARFKEKIKKSFILHIAGMGESSVDEKIRPIIEAERKLEADCVQFTILAHQWLVDIKASVSGRDELLVDETVHNLKSEFYEALGQNIYGEDRQTLESVVGDLLGRGRKTLALAESCTGGLVAHRITNVPGSSTYFLEGVVTYSNKSKMDLLGVKEKTLQSFGAVSEETAREMADGIKERAGSDYALSLTGIAGPGGGTPEKPVGLVYIGLARPHGTEVFRFQFGSNRADVRERAANQALELLRRELLQDKKPGKQ